MLNRLSFKYIVKTYEIFETPSQKFIVIDYLQENSIFEKPELLDMNNIWKYFRNLMSAIEFCK